MFRRRATPQVRAAIGYYAFARRLLAAARSIGAPVLWWHELVHLDGPELAARLPALPVDRDRFLDAVLATRAPRPAPDARWVARWREAADVFARCEGRYGPIQSP